LLVILILGSLETVSLSRQIFKLLAAGGRITRAEQRVSKAQEENKRLKKKLAYVQSREFLEKEARDKLNLAYPDEIVVVIPPELLNLYLDENTKKQTSKDTRPNWRKWQEALFGS
jgi:cell division protein FtsB